METFPEDVTEEVHLEGVDAHETGYVQAQDGLERSERKRWKCLVYIALNTWRETDAAFDDSLEQWRKRKLLEEIAARYPSATFYSYDLLDYETDGHMEKGWFWARVSPAEFEENRVKIVFDRRWDTPRTPEP